MCSFYFINILLIPFPFVLTFSVILGLRYMKFTSLLASKRHMLFICIVTKLLPSSFHFDHVQVILNQKMDEESFPSLENYTKCS